VDEGFVPFKVRGWGDWKEDAKLCRNRRKWTGDSATFANAHLAAAICNNDFYEQLVISTEQIRGLSKPNELPIVEGFVAAPNAPGLGLDTDWGALEKTALAVV
jgi:L-alanine-DL-glutamate epimerase-like enolase superfamily enzyme